jgi:surfeit locus 1 family protein
VAFSALILGLVVLMVNLALWQLRRLDETRDLNDRVVERTAAATVPIDSVVNPGSSRASVADVEWRPVTARGRYDPAYQVLIRNRSFQGQPGYHVVTPLRLADGRALLVNRGWIPLGGDDGAAAPPAPPEGVVTVSGRLRASQRKGRSFSPTDPAEGTLAQLYRVDVPRIGRQTPYGLLPAYIELLATEPATTSPQPALIPRPELDDGPHLSYAGQWLLFSCCAIAGWILVVRRTAGRDQLNQARAAAEPTKVTS